MKPAIILLLASLTAAAAEDQRAQKANGKYDQEIAEQRTVVREIQALAAKHPHNYEYRVRLFDATMRAELLEKARSEEKADAAAKLAALAAQFAAQAAQERTEPIMPARVNEVEKMLDRLNERKKQFEELVTKGHPEATNWLDQTNAQIANLEKTLQKLKEAVEAEKRKLENQSNRENNFRAEQTHQEVVENGHRVDALGHAVEASIAFSEMQNEATEKKHQEQLAVFRGQRPAAPVQSAAIPVAAAGGNR